MTVRSKSQRLFVSVRNTVSVYAGKQEQLVLFTPDSAAMTSAAFTVKSYAFDFKQKIAAKEILRFHQLSGPIGRFFCTLRRSTPSKPSRKVPSPPQLRH
jgi:hypothetical protein